MTATPLPQLVLKRERMNITKPARGERPPRIISPLQAIGGCGRDQRAIPCQRASASANHSPAAPACASAAGGAPPPDRSCSVAARRASLPQASRAADHRSREASALAESARRKPRAQPKRRSSAPKRGPDKTRKTRGFCSSDEIGTALFALGESLFPQALSGVRISYIMYSSAGQVLFKAWPLPRAHGERSAAPARSGRPLLRGAHPTSAALPAQARCRLAQPSGTT